jgi:hypothetical protein
MVFEKDESFSKRLLFDAKALKEIVAKLREAGFPTVSIQIPERGYDNFPQKVFSAENFIDNKYNFLAQILTAKNDTETIKILFVNHGRAISSFNDRTFPSGHSMSPTIHVESHDPVRLPGMLDFVQSLLAKNSTRNPLVVKAQNALFVFGALYVIFTASFLFTALSSNEGSFWSATTVLENYPWTILLPIACVLYLLFYVVHPGGIYVAPFEHPLVSFYRRLSAGDLRNNLIVATIILITKFVIGGILLGVIVNITSEILSERATDYVNSLLSTRETSTVE